MRHVDSLDGGELLTIETSDGRNMSVARTELEDGTIIATTNEGPVYTIYELDSTMNGRIRLNPPTPPPAPAAAKTASPTDTTTATKQDIQDAQQRLRALRYDVGPADGLMGAKTTAAIKKFQSDRGPPVTGILDAKALEALKR
jgi:peptidoglycan hydrolase-like protein with peptidoglycan-binding domain